MTAPMAAASARFKDGTMIKIWEWWPTQRIAILVKIADELWFNTGKDDEKLTHLFRIGWCERPDCPGVRLYAVTVLWLSVKVGVVKT
ncbi:MAG: hypothetical protein WBG17_13830 [Burkholderiaceae bacterium]